MLILSIIIVNYNVKYFLEQCLCSVEKALAAEGLELTPPPVRADALIRGSGEGLPIAGPVLSAEIFVVDNHSSDGSGDWLPSRFPRVQFILNEDNRGFGAANNQALARAKGEYILFLNPDTILPEDCFTLCLSFMAANPAAGAAGLRMIDGSGSFLKESRRGFPTPWVAFCKLSGLTALFPRSPLFAKYYLGHLAPMKDHPSPILPGAFMFVRKEALDKTGGFDERFFLYAEDIDLSWRIEQAGYTNYYLAAATILHFKGESTPKDARYVKLFYKAMSQFRRKYSRGRPFWRNSFFFNALMETAIWGRAGLQAMGNLFRNRSDKGKTEDGKSNDGKTDQSETDDGKTDHSESMSGITAGESSGNASRQHSWVCGDETDASRCRSLLAARNRIPAPNAAAADEIIFCEGAALSFKEIIRRMEEEFPKADGSLKGGMIRKSRSAPLYKIHAAGSAAAVGSANKEERGEAILL
jgi:N-acetylglucosaminyl-diphospho-decaprenol L-rhamnosyltransferase